MPGIPIWTGNSQIRRNPSEIFGSKSELVNSSPLNVHHRTIWYAEESEPIKSDGVSGYIPCILQRHRVEVG